MGRLHHRRQPAIPVEGGGTVRKFPAPSLMCVIAELKREKSMREHVYPRLIDIGKITEDQALYQQRCLAEAIEILEKQPPPALFQRRMNAADIGL